MEQGAKARGQMAEDRGQQIAGSGEQKPEDRWQMTEDRGWQRAGSTKPFDCAPFESLRVFDRV